MAITILSLPLELLFQIVEDPTISITDLQTVRLTHPVFDAITSKRLFRKRTLNPDGVCKLLKISHANSKNEEKLLARTKTLQFVRELSLSFNIGKYDHYTLDRFLQYDNIDDFFTLFPGVQLIHIDIQGGNIAVSPLSNLVDAAMDMENVKFSIRLTGNKTELGATRKLRNLHSLNIRGQHKDLNAKDLRSISKVIANSADLEFLGWRNFNESTIQDILTGIPGKGPLSIKKLSLDKLPDKCTVLPRLKNVTELEVHDNYYDNRDILRQLAAHCPQLHSITVDELNQTLIDVLNSDRLRISSLQVRNCWGDKIKAGRFWQALEKHCASLETLYIDAGTNKHFCFKAKSKLSLILSKSTKLRHLSLIINNKHITEADSAGGGSGRRRGSFGSGMKAKYVTRKSPNVAVLLKTIWRHPKLQTLRLMNCDTSYQHHLFALLDVRRSIQPEFCVHIERFGHATDVFQARRNGGSWGFGYLHTVAVEDYYD